MTLRQLIEVADHAAVRLFREDGVVQFTWHMVDRSGNHLIKNASCNDKDTEVMLMKVFMEITSIAAVVIICEGWRLASDDISPEEKARIDREGISKNSRRIESILFSGEDAASSILAWRDIIRPVRGKPRLGPLEFMPNGGIGEGRFVGLLPRQGTVQ